MFGGLKISTPVFIQKPKRHFIGHDRMMSFEDIPTIPDQWAAFNAAGHLIGNAIGKGAYGIVHSYTDDNTWRYACAYEVSKFGAIPDGYAHIATPSGNYAVFKSSEQAGQIGEVISAVTDWVETSDYQSADGPMLEVYGPSYVPETGEGGFEIWILVKPAD
ncbi:MAG: GyrI-like domain-containing protein [Yoonia sp.]|nr:GyrI-like domain-containing protein [Yoonia sp.]